MRTILIHLNVEVEDDDERSPDQIMRDTLLPLDPDKMLESVALVEEV